MNYKFKEINIGNLIKLVAKEKNITNDRLCNYLKISEIELFKLYQSESVDTEILLQCSKLLEYDFFRIYSQHLLLYAPFTINTKNSSLKKSGKKLPEFRKNLYTPEIISFIIELIETQQKTPLDIINEYRIPKSTLYKWIKKHNTIED